MCQRLKLVPGYCCLNFFNSFFINSRIAWLVRVIECENISGIWKGVKVEKWLQKLSSSSMDCKRIAGKGISSGSFNEVARLNEGKQKTIFLYFVFFLLCLWKFYKKIIIFYWNSSLSFKNSEFKDISNFCQFNNILNF